MKKEVEVEDRVVKERKERKRLGWVEGMEVGGFGRKRGRESNRYGLMGRVEREGGRGKEGGRERFV